MKGFLTIFMALILTLMSFGFQGCGHRCCYEAIALEMTAEASRREGPFTVEDFTELNLISVTEFSPFVEERRFIFLILENGGRQNMSRALDALNARYDVYNARHSRCAPPE